MPDTLNLPANPSMDQIFVTTDRVSYVWNGKEWVSKHVRLTKVPDAGQYIVIQKRIGRVWTPQNTSLNDSPSDQAKFIRSGSALLPDKNKV
jgi:hypothetical protein